MNWNFQNTLQRSLFLLSISFFGTNINAQLADSLYPPMSPQPFASEGQSVALNSLYFAAGKPGADSAARNAGAVEIYSAVGFSHVLTIVNPCPDNEDGFGNSVALSGNLLMVGASRDQIYLNGGVVYVFDLAAKNPVVPIKELRGSTPTQSFGASLAADGNLLVVGSPQTYDQGEAYVFDLSPGGAQEPLLRIPTPVTSVYHSGFGASVAIDGSLVVIGQSGENVSGGVATNYVFDMQSARPAQPVHELEGLGTEVAISDRRVAVRGDSGNILIHDLESANPSDPIFDIPAPNAQAVSSFGQALGFFENFVVVGAPQDTSSSQLGSCFVFDLDSQFPTEPVRSFLDPDSSNSQMGHAVAISGSRIIVGAPRNDVLAEGAGAALVFDLTSSVKTPLVSLRTASPNSFDLFGSSCAASAGRLVVGSPKSILTYYESGSSTFMR